MNILFSQGKLKVAESRSILQAIESQMQQVIISGVTLILQELLEQEVTTKLGRPKRSPRRVSSQLRAIDWRCARCGCEDAKQFTRDSHYRRSLETGRGTHGQLTCAHAGVQAVSTMWEHCLPS